MVAPWSTMPVADCARSSCRLAERLCRASAPWSRGCSTRARMRARRRRGPPCRSAGGACAAVCRHWHCYYYCYDSSSRTTRPHSTRSPWHSIVEAATPTRPCSHRDRAPSRSSHSECSQISDDNIISVDAELWGGVRTSGEQRVRRRGAGTSATERKGRRLTAWPTQTATGHASLLRDTERNEPHH